MSRQKILTFVILLTLSLSSLHGAAVDPEEIKARKVHRIYIPADDFAAFLQSSHGQALKVLPLAKLRRLVAEDLKLRVEECLDDKKKGEEQPTRPWVALDADFSGVQTGSQFLVKARYRFRLQKPGWHSIPLLRGNVAVSSARVDGSEAKLVVENDRSIVQQQSFSQMDFQQVGNVAPNMPYAAKSAPFFLLINHPSKDKARIHTVNLEFLVPIETVEYYRKASFGALPVPKGLLKLTIDGTELDVTVEQGLGVEKSERLARTTMNCNLRPTSEIDVQWFRLSRSALQGRKKVTPDDKGKSTPEEPEIPVSSLPSFVEAQIFQDVAIGEGRLEGTVTVDVNIHRKAIGSLLVKGPENTLEHLELIEQGDLVRDWRANKDSGQLQIEFKRNAEGKVRLFFRYYTDTKGQSSFTRTVPEFHIANIARETGFIAVRRRTNVSIEQTKETKNLEAIPLTSIPAKYRTEEVAKALLAYRYLKSPYELELKVTRFEDASVLTTMIDEVEASTLVAKDGNCLTKMQLNIRSRTRDPLEINLKPCGAAKMCEVLLNNKPASLSHRKDGGIEVSLADLTDTADKSKPLVLYFSHQIQPLGFSGNLNLSLPPLGATIKNINWSLSVPEDRTFFGFVGNHNAVHGGGSKAPIRLGGGYRRYRLTRALLAKNKILTVQCHYLHRTVQWLPWFLFLLGGMFFVHACLVTLLGGTNTRFFLSSVLVILVILILFSEQLSRYEEAAATGMSLYITLLLFYVGFLAAGKVRDRFTRPYVRSDLTAVETNIARVAPEVEGGGEDA